MKTTFHENPYAVDDGRFLARFVGVTEFSSDKARDKDGNPIPPGWKWEFELCEGQDAGKMANRITSKVPTLKNLCGKIMMSLADGNLADGIEFDSDAFKGFYYRITIRDGIISDNPPPSFVGTQRPSDGKDGDKKSIEQFAIGGKASDKPGDPVPF